MQRRDVAILRERLLERRAELVAAGSVPIEFVQDDDPTKTDDDAAPLTEMTQIIASGRNRARTRALQAIEQALQRLASDPDTYGLCETCDEPIPIGRLALMPEVTRCAECQAEDEQANPRGGPRRHLTDFH